MTGRSALTAKQAGELLTIYLNWQSRLIEPRPRQVHTALPFDGNPITKERQAAIKSVIKDIETGRDLTKYLSRNVRIGFEVPRNPKKKKLYQRRDLDMMLNDWGIHHLHVSTEVEHDGFVERGNPLIFAFFKPENAYLIDIMEHGDWTCEQVIRVIVDSWPNAGLLHEFKGVLNTQKSWTDEERGQLRGARISTLISIGDRTFLPGLGISTAGTSTAASMHAMRILRALKGFEEQAEANPEGIISAIRQHGGKIEGAPNFVFGTVHGNFAVIETNSRAAIPLF
jgi:hypothetical protein